MDIQTMEKHLMQTSQQHQTVRIQSQNHLYVGTVKGLQDDTLTFQTAHGTQKFDMNQVDNYKIMK